MNTLIRSLGGTSIMVGMLAGTANASTLISDTFSGSAVDTSVWNVVTPFANSSVAVSGGDAIFKGIGTLVSKNPVVGTPGASLDIRGSFAFTGNPNDSLHVTLRTSGIPDDAWGNMGGEGVLFAMSYFDVTGLGPSGTFNDQRYTFGTPLVQNTYYNFRITDDGSNVSVYFTDLTHPLITVATTYKVGNLFALSDRDENGSNDSVVNAGSQVNLSYITVNAVPEPSSLALLGLFGAGWAFLRRRTS